MSRLARASLCSALLALALGATSCAQVKPWERETLARRDMAWDPDPREAMIRGHVFFSKEASLAGGAAAGGGCGCN